MDCPVAYSGEFTASAVSGQRDYTLPSNFLPPLWSIVFDYGLTTERELPYLPPERAAAYNALTASVPAAYTFIHKQGVGVIRILPAPSISTTDNILVHCAATPSTFAASEDCPLNPILHDAVVSYARYRAWEEWEQFEYSMRAKMEYDERIARGRRLLGAVLIAYPIAVKGPIAPLPASERPA